MKWSGPANRSQDERERSHGGHGPNGLIVSRRFQQDLPLISILIPAYNAQEWIADTIHSAIAQTWPRTEIIVVDDGSSDSTLAIARTFESQGVRVISQKNQGASAARNTAFLHSRGDYIQWLDADDLLAPDKIARQMELVMKGLSPRTLLSSPWAHFMYRTRHAEFIPSSLWCDLSPKEWLLCKMEQNIYMQTATWLVSRELTEAAGPWDIRMIGDDDGEYFCRVLLASNGVRFVPEAKVYYRAFQFASLSYIGRFPHKIEAHWASMQLHIRYLRSFGDDARVRAACLQFLRDSLIYFYPETSHIVQEAEQLASELGGSLGRSATFVEVLMARGLVWVVCRQAGPERGAKDQMGTGNKARLPAVPTGRTKAAADFKTSRTMWPAESRVRSPQRNLGPSRNVIRRIPCIIG